MIALPGGFRPKKWLDQYFLRDHDILQREVYLANIEPSDVVMEIGAGNGALTRLISERARKVVAIEKDHSLARSLRDAMPGNVDVIEGDALEVDYPSFDKAMGNLPYSISSPLLFRLLEYEFTIGVLCLQYEFALKMTASPGTPEYSRLSVMVALKTSMTCLSMKVPRECFWPVPNVDSAVVKFAPEKTEDLNGQTSEIIRMVFSHRRKTLRNAVRDSDRELKNRLGISSNEVLERISFDFETRVFEIPPPAIHSFAKSVGELGRIRKRKNIIR
jgi:16S rRNA (adenine1518-N6/adenine1519-N6)-dimethyltransferase